MGPTHVDPLVHARSIVRKCMVRGACNELATAKGPQWVAELRDFGRRDDGPSFEASSTELRSAHGERPAQAATQRTKVRTAAIFALACIIISALIVSRILVVQY